VYAFCGHSDCSVNMTGSNPDSSRKVGIPVYRYRGHTERKRYQNAAKESGRKLFPCSVLIRAVSAEDGKSVPLIGVGDTAHDPLAEPEAIFHRAISLSRTGRDPGQPGRR
jgi:hypothetical protein